MQQIPFSTVCKELYGLHTLLRNDAPHKPFARHDGRRAGHADGLLCAAGAPLRQRRAAADGGLRDPRSRPCAGRCYHGKQAAGRRLYRRHGPYGAGRRLCRRAGGRAQPRQCLRRRGLSGTVSSLRGTAAPLRRAAQRTPEAAAELAGDHQRQIFCTGPPFGADLLQEPARTHLHVAAGTTRTVRRGYVFHRHDPH